MRLNVLWFLFIKHAIPVIEDGNKVDVCLVSTTIMSLASLQLNYLRQIKMFGDYLTTQVDNWKKGKEKNLAKLLSSFNPFSPLPSAAADARQ